MNPFLIILFILLLAGIVAFGFWLAYLLKPVKNPNANNSPNVIGTCTVSTSSVPQITLNQCCTDSPSTGLFPTPMTGIDLPVIVGLSPVYYVTACQNLCPPGVQQQDGSCVPDSPAYDQCLELIKPVNCIGTAMPIAVNGIQFYYIQAIGSNVCTLGPCPA